MSNIMEILLCCDGERIAINKVNELLKQHYPWIPGFEISDRYPFAYAALNHLPIVGELIEIINSTAWRNPDGLQLFVRGEDDAKFMELEIRPGKINYSMEFITEKDGAGYDPFTQTYGHWSVCRSEM